MKKAFKNNTPLISIIVPIYNVEKYLSRCINSIIEQTYENLEIILVDDGSPDNCAKICDKYKKLDKRIKVIHKKNGGLSSARNAGISIAKGEYIGFVDSDDFINPNMYSVLYDIIHKENADIACCYYKRFKNDKHLKKISVDHKKPSIRIYNRKQFLEKFYRIKTQECVFYAWNKLYKKDIIDKNQFPLGITCEDVYGIYKALLKSRKICEINYPYYYYNYNDKSITASGFSDKDFDLIRVWDLVLEYSKKHNKDDIKFINLNITRVRYTLLARMATNLKYKEIIKKYNLEYKELLTELKKDKYQLLYSGIPISRKITIILICLNYRASCTLFRILYKIKKRIL